MRTICYYLYYQVYSKPHYQIWCKWHMICTQCIPRGRSSLLLLNQETTADKKGELQEKTSRALYSHSTLAATHKDKHKELRMHCGTGMNGIKAYHFCHIYSMPPFSLACIISCSWYCHLNKSHTIDVGAISLCSVSLYAHLPQLRDWRNCYSAY